MLRSRVPLFAIMVSIGISEIGNRITLLAIPWFVLQTTGSTEQTGIATLSIMLAFGIGGLLGGPLVDQFGHKQFSVYADLFSGVSVLAIPILFNIDMLPLSLLIVLVFLATILDSPGTAARRSLLPEIAESTSTPLERTNAVEQLARRSSFFLGPLLAGYLIAKLGSHNVLWFDGISFFISASLVGIMIPNDLAERASKSATDITKSLHQSLDRYKNDLANGIGFIRQDRTVLSIVMVATLSNFLSLPILIAPVLTLLADRHFGGSIAYGALTTSYGAGTLVGTLIFGFIAHRLDRRLILISGFSLATLSFWIMSAIPSFAIAMCAMVILGLGFGPLEPLFSTVIQERCLPTMRGRIFAAYFGVASTIGPLGMLVTGITIEVLGLQPTIVLISAVYSLLVVGIYLAAPFQSLRVQPSIASNQ